jgi:hypothetical protein
VKKLLINSVTGVIGIVASTIVTAWITGQPLTGLTKIKGLYRTFITSSVPAWAFALVFLVALLGIYYALTHLPKRRPKGKVHFVPDSHNCGWAKQTETQMSVWIGGTFTYDGPGELVILKVYLKGTQPINNMVVQVEPADGSGRMIRVSQLWLPAALSQRTFMNLYLMPVLGIPGTPLRRKLVLHDKFDRDFLIGPIEFPYAGPKV